jgi:hypothetical protein
MRRTVVNCSVMEVNRRRQNVIAKRMRLNSYLRNCGKFQS